MQVAKSARFQNQETFEKIASALIQELFMSEIVSKNKHLRPDAIGLIGFLGVNEPVMMLSTRVILRFSNPLVFADVGQLRVT
jgi:hypothetical protein